jgi:hypothetical protein
VDTCDYVEEEDGHEDCARFLERHQLLVAGIEILGGQKVIGEFSKCRFGVFFYVQVAGFSWREVGVSIVLCVGGRWGSRRWLVGDGGEED